MSSKRAAFEIDAFSPAEVALRVENVGVTKAMLNLVPLFTLGVLAGGFIGLGAMFYTVVVSDTGLTPGTARLLGGAAFSLGLVLVVVAGAELFTGNNLLVIAWASKRITSVLMFRNLAITYVANFVGATGALALVYLAGIGSLDDGQVAQKARAIAMQKTQLGFDQAFFRGVLCNVLVCLAVWIAMAARTVSGKIIAIVFPITAFVTCGLEHCVANMYLIPAGFIGGAIDPVTVLSNLVPVTLGNFVGGTVLVGLVYHLVYRHSSVDK